MVASFWGQSLAESVRRLPKQLSCRPCSISSFMGTLDIPQKLREHPSHLFHQSQSSGSSHHGSGVTNLTNIHEDAGSIPGLAQWVKDPVLLWLLSRPAATALVGPLAWEVPYAKGMGKNKKDRMQTEKKPEKQEFGKALCPSSLGHK